MFSWRLIKELKGGHFCLLPCKMRWSNSPGEIGLNRLGQETVKRSLCSSNCSLLSITNDEGSCFHSPFYWWTSSRKVVTTNLSVICIHSTTHRWNLSKIVFRNIKICFDGKLKFRFLLFCNTSTSVVAKNYFWIRKKLLIKNLGWRPYWLER